MQPVFQCPLFQCQYFELHIGFSAWSIFLTGGLGLLCQRIPLAWCTQIGRSSPWENKGCRIHMLENFLDALASFELRRSVTHRQILFQLAHL